MENTAPFALRSAAASSKSSTLRAEVVESQVWVHRAGRRFRIGLGDEDDQPVDVQINPGLPVGLDRLQDFRPEHLLEVTAGSIGSKLRRWMWS